MIRYPFARGAALCLTGLACLALAAAPALAEPKDLSVELNKLEPQGAGCRAYVVVQNNDDAAYKTFALKMRDGSCNQCHVPNNPDGMKKLVLLQTPVHAASEIKRVLKTVRADTMPLDELGIEKPLDKVTKEALLKEGVVFDQLLDEAKAWEAAQGAKLSQK